jgi:hypothetical protein
MISFTDRSPLKTRKAARGLPGKPPLDRLGWKTSALSGARADGRPPNESAYVVHVAKLLAQLRQEDYDACLSGSF